MSIPISQVIPLTTFPFGVHMFLLYVCVSISVLQIRSSTPFFQIPQNLKSLMTICPWKYNSISLCFLWMSGYKMIFFSWIIQGCIHNILNHGTEISTVTLHALSMFTYSFTHTFIQEKTLSMKLEHGDEQHKIPSLKFSSLWGKQNSQTTGLSESFKNDIKEIHVQGPTEA